MIDESEHPAWDDDPAVQASQILTTALEEPKADRVMVAIGLALLAIVDELRYLEDTIATMEE